MTFTSGTFLLFLPAVVLLAFRVPGRRRWIVLLAAGYLFYASLGIQYLLALLWVTGVVYVGGRLVAPSAPPTKREPGVSPAKKALLAVFVLLASAALLVLKYGGFIVSEIAELAGDLPVASDTGIYSLIAPVGLAFYTLKGAGYLIDVYRERTPCERHLGRLAVYVGFFPQLLSGPIERAGNFLPQLHRPAIFSSEAFRAGLGLMLLGYVKKLVVADQLAVLANTAFSEPQAFTGLPLVLATLAFTLQIYFDFSGYTDLAVGAGMLLGFKPVANFRRPYLARGLGDFWHRWHISLSTWFRDYLYFPLGGSRVGTLRHLANLNITFWASGLWHGAGLTFLAWGALHGLFLSVESLLAPFGVRLATRAFPEWVRRWSLAAGVLVTFVLVGLAWVLFRAESIGDAVYVYGHLLQGLELSAAAFSAALTALGLPSPLLGAVVLGVLVLLLADELREEHGGRPFVQLLPGKARLAVGYAAVAIVLVFGNFGANEFIYFQF